MSELKDKEIEQVKGGTFIPTLTNSFVPDDLEEPINVTKDDIPNVDISKYRLVSSKTKLQ